MPKRLAFAVLAIILLLAAAVAVNTLRQGSRQVDVGPAPPLPLDEAQVADTLAGALRFRTIASATDANANEDQFLALHAYLAQRFPKVHAALRREVVNGTSLLYTWKGSDPQANAVAWLAHLDVVPIEPGTEARWTSPPFAGEVRDGYAWGRGSWDDKGNIVAQLEAVEQLLAQGFQPKQTLYLAYGADEEVSGVRGAARIAKLLAERQVRLEYVLDEGLFVGEGFIPGLDRPAAIVGIAEKGYLSVELKATGPAGHSSTPPPGGGSAIGKLGGALQRLEREPFPAGLRGVARDMFETLAPEMSGVQRVVLSNLWLFGPLVQSQLEKSAGMNSMLRTTTALTIVQGGNKDNVVPGNATAVVNFRILPGQTRADVLRHVREKVGEGIEVREMPGGKDPTPVSPLDAPSWQLLQRTMRSIDPRVIVAPGLFTAGSDSTHYLGLTENVYRFSPVRVTPADLPSLHGTNERLATRNLADMVRFYHQLLRGASAAGGSVTPSP